MLQFLRFWPVLPFFLLVSLSPIPPKPALTDRPNLKQFFDDQKVDGSFLLLDPQQKQYIAYRPDRCRKRYLPASTFKILNTLIGLETGVVADENFVIKWDGVKRSIAAWNQDLTLMAAFRASAVPYYQELARRVGIERMTESVKKARYGRMRVKAATLDSFWLTGRSGISPMEQVDFLRRIYTDDVPFSKRNLLILKKIMLIDEKPGYKLYGKTGWVDYPNPRRGQPQELNVGWFVGYVETGEKVYYFATCLEQPSPIPASFIPARRQITEAILRELKLIPQTNP
jgi:beta-lactamase class D